MVKNHTSKTYAIGDPISAGTFRKYIEHFYNGHLRLAGEKFLEDGGGAVQRPTFVAVAHSLLATGDFKTGERFRLPQVAIAEISGVSTKSVRRVLRLLEKLGAIRVVDTSKRPGGGMPVKFYTLTYSEHVHAVLSDKNRDKARDQWKRPERSTTSDGTRDHNPSALGTTTPITGEHNPNQWEPQPHNRNPQEQERTDSDKSSPAPVVAEPSARSGAAESQVDWMDELLSEIGALPLDGL